MMIYHHKRRLVVQKSGGTAKYTIPVVSEIGRAYYIL
jgi:hypothetical protein